MHNPYQSQIDQLKSQIEETSQLLADEQMKDLAQLELEKLQTQLTSLESAAAEYADTLAASNGSQASEEKINCILEFRPGAGGDEAKIWANDLQRMYVRYAETLGLKIQYIDDLVVKLIGKTKAHTELHELHKESGTYITAYDLFKYESGVHRVQRVPETESQGRIHTSTASVAVVPEVPQNAVEIRDEDIEWQFMRASGAGGQSVNKTNSAVRLIHTPSGIAVTSRQEKKQEQNRKIALDLLRSQLWEIEEEKRLVEIGQARIAIGRNKRAEKIRTYNYPQNRVTDHRTKQSWHNLPEVVSGVLEKLLTELHLEIAAQNEAEAADTTTADSQ